MPAVLPMLQALAVALIGALPPGPPAADPVARVDAWLAGWETLGGRFEQVVTAPTLPGERRESGRFEIRRPDQMRWDYESPERKQALTDGITTWLYTPADRQVIRGRMDRLRRDSALALLLAGSSRLRESFRIEPLEGEAGVETIRLRLMPLHPSESIDHARLEADGASGRILALEVLDLSGNRVLYRFSDLIENPPLEPARFVLEIPAGVEIQDLDSAGAGAPGPP